MTDVEALIATSKVHPEWQGILQQSLQALEPSYLQDLIADPGWLPGSDNLLAAFRRNMHDVRFVLIGESPYPRAISANGIAFYDAAVDGLWSDNGLSKAVNRATSMRNIIKTALLAEGHLRKDRDGKIPQALIAATDKTRLVKTMPDFFDNFHRAGFLLLNATPVYHPARKPAQEANYWRPFLKRFLPLLAKQLEHRATLLLWGKIATEIEALPIVDDFDKLVCEHPYNLSFIDNPDMQKLFSRLKLLQG